MIGKQVRVTCKSKQVWYGKLLERNSTGIIIRRTNGQDMFVPMAEVANVETER